MTGDMSDGLAFGPQRGVGAFLHLAPHEIIHNLPDVDVAFG